MDSISYKSRVVQAPRLSAFRYALKLSPRQIERLSRDELVALCLEQYFLLWLIVAIIRNPLAAIATRVVAVDLIISLVEKNVRGKIAHITERTRVYISGDGGAAKRLGIHPNTVSKTYKNLETYHMLERTYIFDESTQKEYLDLTLCPLQLEAPEKLQDKTLRTLASAGKRVHTEPDLSPASLTCPACGSTDVQIVCRTCGSVSCTDEIHSISQDQSENEASSLLHKVCVVESINPPLDGEIAGIAAPVLLNNDITEIDAGRPGDTNTDEPLSGERAMQTQTDEADQQLISWLQKRRGHGRLIYATGSAEYSKKYYNKPPDYQPDYPAYVSGDKRHIYGSYLSFVDGTTYVVAFDIDDPKQHNAYLVYLRKLAEAGASPIYWMREGGRGHLELYFDRPVSADQALAWCQSVCPELSEIEECYPAKEKRNQPISWPLYQRKGDRVSVCQAKAMLAHTSQVRSASPKNLTSLAALIEQAVTPAALVASYQQPQTSTQPDGKVQNSAPPLSPLPRTTEDLAKVVIAEFNRTTTWDEVVRLCGGFTRDGKFKAVWRNERTPSVTIDANGGFASDYGRTAGFPRKLDKYEIWCLAQGGLEFKRFDLAARMEEYRKRQEQIVDSPPPAQEQDSPKTVVFTTEDAGQPVQPPPDESGEEIITRLRVTVRQTGGRVMTPDGPGRIWQLWPERIGVVLDSDPEHVRFFTELSQMRHIVAASHDQENG